MENKYTVTERAVLWVYLQLFGGSNISLKKYSRSLYMLSLLLLVINFSSLWFLGRFEEQIIDIFALNESSLHNFSGNFNLTINILELTFGGVGGFLDLAPSESKISVS